MADESKILNPDLWIDNYGDYLYNYAYSKLFSVDLAEDLLQETFLSAFKSVDSFKGKSTEKTWLISILKRRIADYYRKKMKEKEDKVLDNNSPFITDKFRHGAWKEDHRPTDWGATDVDLSDSEDFIVTLKKCISLLPDKWKAVFSLKHVENASNNDIIDELGVSESNIWTILHRSRLQLRECIEKLWFKN